MRRQFAVCLGLLALAVAPVRAASTTDLDLFGKDPGQDRVFACYTRVYDAAHLKAHPLQNVRDMTLLVESRFDDESAERNYTLAMGVHFRKLTTQLMANGGCSGSIDGQSLLNCGIDCDGGQIDVRLKDANRILVDIPYGARTWNPEDDEDTPPDAPPAAQFGDDDKTFLLSRAALDQCVDLVNDDDKPLLTATH